ncbi:hypothetical protein Zmor_002039 [Zophobas morio]|uniref:HTH psq-type domain-containing protein n=1 Tax=Zophobas morio TaxID=2755281 RepID=A0AA38J3R6_9CUCU|nr:hypothetical protein Zmor_002039 [Zophobas morio]
MPRKYKRKTQTASWSEETLKAALLEIDNGSPLRAVSRRFGIPRSTLQDRCRTKNTGQATLGRNPVFSKAEEKELVEHIIQLSKMFYGITPFEIKQCAFKYAIRNNVKNPFLNEAAGRAWLEGFLKRNPQISLRRPEGTSLNRIKAFNRDEVSIFFKNLNNVMDKYHFSAAQIFNADETGITTVQRPSKIYAQKGQKRVGYATSGEKGKTTTVMCSFSAAGMYVPPMFIFARKRMSPQLKKNGPPEAMYCCSDNGWINETLFLDWLNHFKTSVKVSKEDPVLLILDNHVSHCTLGAYNYCKENGIVLLTIPPHTSHRIQPLDVSFYGPLKTAYHNECDKYLKNHPGEKITPNEVAEIFNKAFARVATLEKAQKGFQTTGIFPVNADVFTDDDFLAAENIKVSIDTIGPHQNREDLHRGLIDPIQPSSSLQTELLEEENTPETSLSGKVSFSEIAPIPSTSSSSSAAKRGTGKKQHSEIVTLTPMKDVLEEKEARKARKAERKAQKTVKRKVLCDDNLTKSVKDSKKGNIVKQREKSSRQKKSVQYYAEDEEMEEEHFSDNDINYDICIICGEFGKNGEIWLRCVSCGEWAHKACSGNDNNAFICDFCH